MSSKIATIGVGLGAIGLIYLLSGKPEGAELLYSKNLADLELFAECNPGGTTDCPCSLADVGLVIHPSYGEVVSNIHKRHTWVNALAVSKHYEKYPDNTPIGLHQYSFSFETRLPTIPSLDIEQQQNAEQIDFAIILYDGRNQFGRGAKRRYEIAGIWKLNPHHPDHNKVLVRTANGSYMDTGIFLPYDQQWHHFIFKGDHDKEELISITVDGTTVDLSGVPIWVRWSPEWGDDVSIWAAVESQAMYPQPTCEYIFWWNQHYRSIKWELIG